MIKRADSSVYLLCEASNNCTHAVVLDDTQVASLQAPTELNPERSRQRLIVDHKLAVSLYHGTSSLFYESIKKFGLGGRDIVKELGVIDLLGQLVRICDEYLPTSDEEIMTLHSARRINSQEVTRGGWNFRHGSTYLTPSQSTAARYATGKEFGSEAIDYCMILYRKVAKEHSALLTTLRCDPTPLLSFVAEKHVPLMIEVQSVPLTFLRSEHGDSPEAHLRFLEELLNDGGAKDIEVVGQQLNFELVSPVPQDQLAVFRIKESYTYGQSHIPLEPYA